MTHEINELVPDVSFLQEGTQGRWQVERFEIGEKELANFDLGTIKDGPRAIARMRRPKMGTFTRLVYTGGVFEDTVMSDVEGEKWELERFVRIATGTVLINGLGLGVALNAVLLKPDVYSVYVIEKSKEVCALVGEQFEQRVADGVYGSKGLLILHDDAFTWKLAKGEMFNVVWHDIWTNITSDNLTEITKLKRKYARRLIRPGAWQGAWAEMQCRFMKRLNNAYGL